MMMRETLPVPAVTEKTRRLEFVSCRAGVRWITIGGDCKAANHSSSRQPCHTALQGEIDDCDAPADPIHAHCARPGRLHSHTGPFARQGRGHRRGAACRYGEISAGEVGRGRGREPADQARNGREAGTGAAPRRWSAPGRRRFFGAAGAAPRVRHGHQNVIRAGADPRAGPVPMLARRQDRGR